MSQSLSSILKILLEPRSLSADEARTTFAAMMVGDVSHAEMGALLALLAVRGPSADELLGAAMVMRENVARVPTLSDPSTIVDTCGTGGAPKTFNVSTTAAIVAAACGVKVAKHGNRSRTGRGSAEVLRALGVNVDADGPTQARCLDEAGLCFCFAIHHHPATKNVMPVRMALGVPTIFNLLGPLTNPAGAKRQVLGVYEARFLEPMARALQALGSVRAIVLHSDDGLDEISLSSSTRLVHVSPEGIREERVTPEELGLPRMSLDAVRVDSLEQATEVALRVLDGSERGATRHMTLMNAAAALLVADVVSDLKDGVARAAAAIDEGRARAVLAKLVETSA
jgi:anthranilate phosphoribosyltransferase